MTTPSDKTVQAVHLLAAISKLGLKAYKCKTLQALIFLILNDTHQIIKYNRAALWQFDDGEPSLVGISGSESVNKRATLVKIWSNVIRKIKDPERGQILLSEDLKDIPEVSEVPELMTPHSSIAWLPIMIHGKLVLGLWLERWYGKIWEDDEVEILNFLMQNYGAAWEKFHKSYKVFQNRNIPLFVGCTTGVLISLFIVHLPLRVVAPCEVVSFKPVVVAAPLEGIIKEIVVEPGQEVKAGELLFEYDPKVPEEEFRVAQKEVQIIQAELNRASSLAFKDKKALAEIGVLGIKLKKEQVQLDLAKYKFSKLKVTSPIDGVVIVENKDDWRGAPVRIGEKVLMVSDTAQTKLRMWIPENDNISLNWNEPIKVILNVNPNKTYLAKLNYVATHTAMNEKGVSSIVAEGDWIENPEDIKLGLKGTAILYGEEVSLFYWIFRRPWTYFRNLLNL